MRWNFHSAASGQIPKDAEEIETTTGLDVGEKLKTLDVGSCFNPFRDVDFMDVTAIDLSPAAGDVYAGDFLTVPIIEEEDVRVSDNVDAASSSDVDSKGQFNKIDSRREQQRLRQLQ